MIRFLLDTNICIDIIRRRSEKALRRLTASPVGQVGISSITLAELEYGVYKSADPQRNAVALLEFCTPLEIAPFDEHAALAYGRIRAVLEHKGRTIGPMDMLIAAHALALETTLVTNNLREFKRIKDLQLENWTAQ